MYEITVRMHFSAAHHLRGYHGKCEAPHGHNWDVEVAVCGAQLDSAGMLMDFHELKDFVRTALKDFDHTDLNLLPGFERLNPTSENIARMLCERVSTALAGRSCGVRRVTVWETPGCGATYWNSIHNL